MLTSEAGLTGWYKLLPELEGQAYNIPCADFDIEKLENEMEVSYLKPNPKGLFMS